MSPERGDVLAATIDRLRADYVFPATADHTASALERARDAGLLDATDDELPRLCETITGVLQEASGDLHLRLLHHPDGAPDPDDVTDYAAYWEAQASTTAGGVRSVRRLEGNVAVVELGPFLGLPVYAGTWQSAAMNLCHGAATVVLDLRECVGGAPDSTALLCSYLFDSEPRHLTTVLDRAGSHQFWTLPVVPGSRLGPEVPVAVLVSSRTFSGGEEVAFVLQELGRATVVGERTRGGAHPRIGVRVHPEVELALPVASPQSPRTGGNWEGTGVTPDVEVPASDALDEALRWCRRRFSTDVPGHHISAAGRPTLDTWHAEPTNPR